MQWWHDQLCSNISWPLCEPVCVFSLLVSLKERRVGHFVINWDRFAHTPVPHASDMPRGHALTDWPYAYLVLHLHTTPPSVIVYRARFILMHFSRCISTTRETLERIDGCFFRATYSGKGGAYDLTAHYYSLLVRRNNRAESPMRLCTTPPFLNMLRSICLSWDFNEWLHTKQTGWIYTLKYVHLKFVKR